MLRNLRYQRCGNVGPVLLEHVCLETNPDPLAP